MNSEALIPLLATIAYVPCLIILLDNRPWQLKQRLFFLLLISAMLWSISDVFFRGSFFVSQEYREVLVRVVLCLAIWMIIQFRYLGQSFYKSEVGEKPFVYLILAAAIALAVTGHLYNMSHHYDVWVEAQDGILVHYGRWMSLLVVSVLIIGSRDIYQLIRKLRLSDNAAERNQIIYFFVAFGCLATFGFATMGISAAGKYPVAHIGNFLSACVLTYAVVAHRLLDVRIVFRRALMYLCLYGGGLGVILLFFLVAHLAFQFQPDFRTLGLAVGAGIPVIVFAIRNGRDFLQRKLEQAFVGARYSYRRQLSHFSAKIQNVPTLEQFGSDFISLLAQSIDCRRASLLLPEAEEGEFRARFVYPPVQNNPMAQLKLRQDGPILAWLKRERTMLPKNNLAILPEFQSMWQQEKDEVRLASVDIFVPLMNRGELVGVLAVSERRDGRLYAVEDTDLLESVGTQVAASMEKEYFHEQLREQDKEITLINQLTTIITSTVSIQEIFERFVQELKKVVDINWATIALIDGNELHLMALSSTVDPVWRPGERIPLEGTGTEYVCREKKSLYEPDLARYHRFKSDERHLQQGIRSILYLPLSIKDEGIGSLVLASLKPNAYGHRHIRLLGQVALQIATPIENAQLYARAEQRSRIDELTGLFNRRHFEERLKEAIGRHSRYGDVFSMLLLDLDHFKTYNDIYGHPAGDILLNRIGKIIKGSVRNVDQAFRYGGDEFAVILPQAATDDAYVVAERVRVQIGKEMEEREISVTCSIGVAGYPADGVISGELVTVADTALYMPNEREAIGCTFRPRFCLSPWTMPGPTPDIMV
ncbi:MAG: diguanylate cyclase [Dehalococcoidia bacterium]|nr:diguanylate cyclase [Dehalococcoidia bacterium]